MSTTESPKYSWKKPEKTKNYKYAIVGIDGAYGLIDRQGKLIVDPKYKSITMIKKNWSKINEIWFNKNIESITPDEGVILPKIKNYKDVKKHITTRKELNRVINAMNRATIDNLTQSRSFEGGQKVTKWEYSEIQKAIGRTFKNLETERKTILKGRESIGMGDERLSEISAIEESISSLAWQKGADFKELRQRVFNVGRTDYEMGRAELFQKNYYKALKDIKNFPNYDKLKKELDKIRNPIAFYEFVKKSPTLMDLFLWYKGETVYGSFDSNEDAFLNALENDFGIH